MPDARRQLRLALGCFRAVGSNPWMLVYPASLATGVLACTVGFVGYVLFGWPTGGTPSNHLRWAAVVGYFTVIPGVIAFCSVAFAYEVNEAYEGRSTRPG